jgi:large subunit ribosomal protein L5
MLLAFKQIYEAQIRDSLVQQFGYTNTHQVPKLSKIVLNMGVGAAVSDSKVLSQAVEEMSLIAAQKPIVTKAKKSVASFKIREGMSIGCKVTLRRSRMYEFLERLVITALPRMKDFRGFSVKNFDGKGNLNIGIKEQIIFPEIDFNKVNKVLGLDISIVTSAFCDSSAKALLQGFYVPFLN